MKYLSANRPKVKNNRRQQREFTCPSRVLNDEEIQRVEKYNGKHNILAINDDVQAKDSYDNSRVKKKRGRKQRQSAQPVLLIVQPKRREET
ncbi:unnamed protein product [Brugia timori]|uniref:Uncharacterized protein n=2 Tax=Brugia TaxID=6278 RepID=A8PT97_BRUMA|nr:unnamed protein product [Brugia timori]